MKWHELTNSNQPSSLQIFSMDSGWQDYSPGGFCFRQELRIMGSTWDQPPTLRLKLTQEYH